MTKIKDITNQKFNDLTAVRFVRLNKHYAIWEFLCVCGTKVVARASCVKAGDRKSCGCRRRKPDRYKLVTHLLCSYQHGARKRQLSFDLTREQFEALVFSNCHYCGSDPIGTYSQPRCKSALKRNGIDRKFNQKGYTMDNCVPCCKVCNRLKNNLDIDQFYGWIERVYNHVIREKNNV